MGFSCIKLLFFVISLVKTEKWMQFQRFPSFEIKVCEGTEIAFSRETISDRSICLIECSKYQNCTGVFHAQNTGMCTGCTEIYGISINPIGTDKGTTYYGLIVSGCPEGWFRINNSCYTITGAMTFDEGVETCKAMNAHPVVIETEAENESLKSKLRQLATTAGAVDAYFTAYTDIAMEGTWVVIGTNEPLLFLDWGIGDPNGHTAENCMALYTSLDFKWVDINCKNTYKTLCERDALP